MKQNLKLPNGQIISANDPNYDTYLKQGAKVIKQPQNTPTPAQNSPSEPTGASNQGETAQSGITYQQPPSVAKTPANLIANKNFVNAAFTTYKGRDATAEELAKYTGMKVGDIRAELSGNQQAQPTIDTMSKTEKLTLPNYNQMTGDPDAFIAGVTKMYEQLNQPNDNLVGLQKTQDTYTNKYLDLLTKLAGRKQEQLSLEEKYHLEQKAEAVSEMDSKIQQKIAEYNAINERIASQPILTASINAQQAYQKRIMAADIAVLNAQRAGLLGKYNTAKDYIQRALDLEFGGLQDQITAMGEFLKINKDKLDTAQAKQAKKNQFILNAVNNLLSEQKAEKENLYKLKLALIKNGQDPNLVDMTKSYDENLNKVGKYLQPTKSSGKTITWQMAKDLGDLSLYGKPISSIPEGATITSDTSDRKKELDKATQFVKDNPNASNEELNVALRANTNLTDSDINAILDSRNTSTTETPNTTSKQSWWGKITNWIKSF